MTENPMLFQQDSLNDKTRVVFIITFSPKYEEWGDKPKPINNWTTPSGKWVGIWAGDWGDILLKGLVDHYPEYDCEVWQPDLRADRQYSVNVQNRLRHRNFPATMVRRAKRSRFVQEIFSAEIVQKVCEHDGEDTVFMLPVSVDTKWTREITKSIRSGAILYFNFLNSSILLPFPYANNLLKNINRWFANQERKNWLRRVDNLLTMDDNPDALAKVQTLYPNMRINYFMWGYDLDYWSPVVSKFEARKDLGISSDTYVIFLSQRLVHEYQIDRFIEALALVKTSREVRSYISGHGLPEYQSYLEKIVDKYNLNDIVVFVGYIDDDTLRKYFIAADLYVNLPVNSAGSAGGLKASMTGCPVLIVPTGALYEFLRSYDAGAFVDPHDYNSWVEVLSRIINDDKVKVPTREQIAAHFSWKTNATAIKEAIENSVMDKKCKQ